MLRWSFVASSRRSTHRGMPADREDEEIGRDNVTHQELADLVGVDAEAASALIRGDIRRYLTLIRHADDYTLMAPSVGSPGAEFDASEQAV